MHRSTTTVPKTVTLKINVQGQSVWIEHKNKRKALEQQADSLEIKRQSRILNSHVNKVKLFYASNLQAEFGSWNFISNSRGDVWSSSASHTCTCSARPVVVKLTKIGGIIKTENTTFQHPNKMMWFIFKQPLSPFGSVVMVRWQNSSFEL